MKNIYQSTRFLDKRASEKYQLHSELLMENAACALEALIASLTHKGSVITILCGSGDNGGDGYALARRLSGDYSIRIYQAKEPKSALCVAMCERALACDIKIISKLLPCDVVVDCIVGSGIQGELQKDLRDVLSQAHKLARISIACDVPSGLSEAFISPFIATHTMAMGALTLPLLSDKAKDCVGALRIAKLGLSAKHYEVSSNIKLLESSDMKLPLRANQSCHKGDFGHVGIFSGEKVGASVLSAKSALSFGAGLVSIISKDKAHIPYSLMQSEAIPHNATALALGMGLGIKNAEQILQGFLESSLDSIPPLVLDADVFYAKNLKSFLDVSLQNNKPLVLTPHPKEFSALLESCALAPYNAIKRAESMLNFTQSYPNAVLLLKGANTFIAYREQIFINNLGLNILAKGGSGDVLSGLIAALLAQGQNALDSAIQGSLAHAIAAQNLQHKIANYALSPEALIEALSTLHLN